MVCTEDALFKLRQFKQTGYSNALPSGSRLKERLGVRDGRLLSNIRTSLVELLEDAILGACENRRLEAKCSSEINFPSVQINTIHD